MSKIKQSIIIPYHKDKDMLYYCLKTLEQTLPYSVEIIIVGNNLNHVELDLDIDKNKYNYFPIYENLQYPKAVNFGVAKSTGDIITICDPDVFFLENWYTRLLETLLSSSGIGVVSPKMINPLNNRVLDFGILYSKFYSGHIRIGLKNDHPLANMDYKVQAACSAVFMTKRSLFDKIGGMDIDLPYSYTDCDYCLRLKEHGYETWVIADSQVYHKGHTDPYNSKNYSFRYYASDARGIFYAKNYSRIEDDLYKWFDYSFAYAVKLRPEIKNKYVLLDFSTIYHREYFYECFKHMGLEFYDIINIPLAQRDILSLQLNNHISYNFIDYSAPLMYFVDRFESLFDNKLWFNMRDISNDLVVDRHGNIFSLSDLAEGKC